MDYPNLTQETTQSYYPLGSKTLLMLILKRSGPAFFFFIILIVGLFLINYIPPEYSSLALVGFLIYIALLVAVIAGSIGIGWLEYYRYGLFVSERNLIIKKGMFATEELGIPFRRIRDMKITRSLLDQILGISNIVVILSDFEEKDNMNDESIVFLPSLDKKTAAQIQESILKKSQVEQIDVLSGHENMLKKVDNNQL